MKTYRVENNEGVRFATAAEETDPRSFHFGYHGIEFTDSLFDVKSTSRGFVAYARDSADRYVVTPITLGDASAMFPDGLRTFESVEELDKFYQSVTDFGINYVEDGTESLSIVINSELESISLVKETLDSMFVREDDSWTEVLEEDDYPELSGKVVLIRSQDELSAVRLWDHYQTTGQDRNKIFNFVIN